MVILLRRRQLQALEVCRRAWVDGIATQVRVVHSVAVPAEHAAFCVEVVALAAVVLILRVGVNEKRDTEKLKITKIAWSVVVHLPTVKGSERANKRERNKIVIFKEEKFAELQEKKQKTYISAARE